MTRFGTQTFATSPDRPRLRISCCGTPAGPFQPASVAQKPYTTVFGTPLREWGTRRLRQVEEHYLPEAGNEAREVLDAVERAIGAIDYDEVAARLIRKEKAARPEQHPIDPDEDLLGRHTNDAQDAFR